MQKRTLLQKYQLHIETLFVFILAASVRLTSLNVFRVVDEPDRWDWAVAFYQALLAGDLPGTLVGDGYPGIYPVWLETLWLFLASLYRSVLQGSWLGDGGVYLLVHEWDRTDTLWLQRFPVVLTNTLLVVAIFLYLRKLFGQKLALLAAILISLDPFYLSDSRVNRAEGLLTGLMMVSLLALIAAHRQQRYWPHLLISGIFGGLAWLTKSQALVLLPMFGVISLMWHLRAEMRWITGLRTAILMMLGWLATAIATFIALWPATWTVPGPTFRLMANYLVGKVGEEGVKIFFLGQTVLDEDPGLIFYPVIFILRTTPLMLIGLLLGIWLLIRRRWSPPSQWRAWLDEPGLWAILAYAALYMGGMSLGSHKQDRFLMAAFPALNVLAAAAFLQFAQRLHWPPQRVWLAGSALLAIQLATALPFHPYYFSYFNPLAGGGPVAVQLTRVGWGEGMDQVADYLQSQENPESMVVASRFFHYLVGFKGTRLNLDAKGEWVRADKIIFYIQQSQRKLDPSPGVIRYFEQHVRPEKVITIDRIDYAQIYPNPIQFPADPQLAMIDGQMSLFGYRWEETENEVTVRLIWENLSDSERLVAIRLWINANQYGPWLACNTRPGFEQAARTPGEIVESSCNLSSLKLAPGLYDLQVGVKAPDAAWQTLDFAAGWSAVDVAANGTLERVEPAVAFARLAAEAIPASATPLEHTYYDHVRLLAYEIEPDQLHPGDTPAVTLYWQALRAIDQDAHISLQAFLGDERVALVNGPPVDSTRPTSSWRPGEVIRETRTLDLPDDLPTPALLRLDVGLFLPDTLTPLPVRNLAGENIPGAITTLRLEPEQWPVYVGANEVDATFDEQIRLIGYDVEQQDAQLDVTLYWEAVSTPADNFTAFLHLINPAGELSAQSDVPPGGGFFPTSAWQPGDIVLSRHQLALPADVSPNDYTLLAGLYRPMDGTRLPVAGVGPLRPADNAVEIRLSNTPQ
ncbi:MAG: glycosyltransferase family 39 protein [Anaerolineae bacterium]|nr:glycosyltransferase family 39 protein [Anaerolineae bacterium]